MSRNINSGIPHVLDVRNVDEAFFRGAELLREQGVQRPSRDGMTLECPFPVITSYANPWECVLGYDQQRKPNPFFHFFEALWMLAGRRDVEMLKHYNSQMAAYSDDGEVFHAAYGYRLRHHFGIDQINHCIAKLKKNANDRQVVMQIWDCNSDLDKVSKDIPCNDFVMFRVDDPACGRRLNMTVCCRSNDMIWGCYGSNVVQFAFLHKYIATMAGFRMGRYNQLSHSFHVYTERPQWEAIKGISFENYLNDTYYTGGFCNIPKEAATPSQLMMTYPDDWYNDLLTFLDDPQCCDVRNYWFHKTARPMWLAYECHKQRNYDIALTHAGTIEADDWRLACTTWLRRVREAYEDREARKLREEKEAQATS